MSTVFFDLNPRYVSDTINDAMFLLFSPLRLVDSRFNRTTNVCPSCLCRHCAPLSRTVTPTQDAPPDLSKWSDHLVGVRQDVPAIDISRTGRRVSLLANSLAHSLVLALGYFINSGFMHTLCTICLHDPTHLHINFLSSLPISIPTLYSIYLFHTCPIQTLCTMYQK